MLVEVTQHSISIYFCVLFIIMIPGEVHTRAHLRHTWHWALRSVQCQHSAGEEDQDGTDQLQRRRSLVSKLSTLSLAFLARYLGKNHLNMSRTSSGGGFPRDRHIKWGKKIGGPGPHMLVLIKLKMGSMKIFGIFVKGGWQAIIVLY